MNELPQGFSFKNTRGGLVTVLDEEGKPLVYSISEARALQALLCLERFGGVITSKCKIDKAVDL